jgi:branched-chain amino acid aminotransferase
MGEVIHLDGRFLSSRSEARVSMFDRGYLLGDSVFETIRAYRGRAFLLDRHLARLEHSAAVLGLNAGGLLASIPAIVAEALERSELSDAVLRVSISRGEGPRGIGADGYDHPVLAVTVQAFQPYPAEGYQRGIATRQLSARRIPPECFDPSIKSALYLPAILARRELSTSGLIEGIQRTVDGQLASGLVSNLFLVRGGALITPSLASGCLPGITRQLVLELAKALALPAQERRIEPEELLHADEAFFTNTLMECLPIGEVDGRTLPAAPGAITRRVHQALLARVEEDCR